MLFHNSSDYLTNTRWSMKRLLKRDCFCDRAPEWRRVHAWSIGPTHADGYMQLFPLYILPLLNVYRNANDSASGVMQLYDSQPVVYSANESLNAITSVFNIVYIFAYGLKIVLFSFTGNWRGKGYLHRGLSGFLCTVSTYVIYVCIIARAYSAVPYCTVYWKMVCALFHS